MTALAAKRQQIADGCRILAGAGLAELFTGHVSCATRDGRFLIPAHLHGVGRGMESINPNHVFEVDADGNPVSDSAPEPPEEVVIHSSVLKAREDVKSAVHAHPLYATGVSAANQEIIPASLDAKVFDGTVPVLDLGPKLLYDENDGDLLVDALKDKGAVLIRGHGAVTVGHTVTESVARMWILERAAKLQTIAEQNGGAQAFPEGVDPGFLRGESDLPFEGVFEFLREKYVQ